LLGDAFAFGDLLKNKFAEAFSGVVQGSANLSLDSEPATAPDSTQAPRSLDELFAVRAALKDHGPGSNLPDANSDNSDVHSCDSQTSQASSVTLADGTDAMVRCVKKGHGALECPVCLNLFTDPVQPQHAECQCTFCVGCFETLVKFGDQCPKCARRLPTDPSQWVPNPEIKRAIQEFQQEALQEGGEEAEYTQMMMEMKSNSDSKPKYKILAMSEFALDPKPLATGAYGQVFKGVWTTHNIAVAVKKILRTDLASQEQTMENFRKETEILSMLDHPHVLKLYGAVVEEENVCIVTEFVPGGSLFDLIHTKPLLKPEAVIAISAGVCKGMTYLHSMGIIHRDLKPGNLLMGAVQTASGPQLVVKVADFGLARVQDTQKTMTGGIGTSQYTAPEVLRSERYDSKVDVFSFGIILWEIHAKKLPYGDMTQMQIAVAVATKDHRPAPPANCPSAFWQLMQDCWHPQHESRPSFAEVLSQLEDMQYVFGLVASAQGNNRQVHSTFGQEVATATPKQNDFANTVAASHRSTATQGAARQKRVLRVPSEYQTIVRTYFSTCKWFQPLRI